MEATTIRAKPAEEPKVSTEEAHWRSGPETAAREAQEAFDAAKRRLVETKNAQAALNRIDPQGLHEALIEARPPTPPSEALLRFTIALARRRMKIVRIAPNEVEG